MPVGAAVESALRLRDAAEAGGVFAGEATARLIQPFALLEPTAGGAGEPTTVFKVLGLLASAPGTRAFPSRELSPFVGRERDLAVIEELCAQAAEGRGQVVGIAGEAGAGKSRLLLEFRKRCRPRRPAHLSGTCLSYTTGTPYRPLVDMMRRASRIGEGRQPRPPSRPRCGRASKRSAATSPRRCRTC
ncbi:MAG: AAA family ATPase [Thermoanaerobaculia bacterium]|nr:AAA family ATPase [Thermoanaerobaculia bacterium]